MRRPIKLSTKVNLENMSAAPSPRQLNQQGVLPDSRSVNMVGKVSALDDPFGTAPLYHRASRYRCQTLTTTTVVVSAERLGARPPELRFRPTSDFVLVPRCRRPKAKPAVVFTQYKDH